MTDTEQLPVRIDISPDNHPGTLKGDSHSAALGREILTDLYATTGRINTVAGQVEDRARLAEAAEPLVQRAVTRATQALATIEAREQQLGREVQAAITPKVEPTLAAQIRAHALGKAGDALPLVMQAIRAGDAVTTSAILSAPAYLSGLSEEHVATLREAATRQFAGDLAAQLGEAKAARAKVDNAANKFVDTLGPKLAAWRDQDTNIIKKGLQS